MDNDTHHPESNDGVVNAPAAPRRPRRRVRAACDRCRRQKLGCDKVRPCAMCLRSESDCITSAVGETRTRRHTVKTRPARASTPDIQNGSPNPLEPASPALETRSSRTSERSEPRDQAMPGPLPSARTASNTSGRYSERGFSLGDQPHGHSAIDLTRQIFNRFEGGSECENETFALPGGSESSVPHPPQDHDVLLRDMIGMNLPPRHVTDFLIDTYMNSVHWFMMVFHEPTFMADYRSVVTTGVVSQSKVGFVVLLLMVLTIGARYATPQAAQQSCPGTCMASLQISLLGKVKESMFDLYDQGRIEAVQTSILLASFYLYHERPNLAFAILGAGINSAQAMGLHREPSWKHDSVIARETRRRTWWALYVFDRFASIIYGRPCSINDNDCEVSMVSDLDDTSTRHPKYSSLETLDDKTTVPVTILSYQRFKFNLYRIASPILGNVYYLRGASKSQVIERVGEIHTKLVSWLSSLPAELRVPDQQTRWPRDAATLPVETIFGMQAVALQLAYDNIMILLHRPLLQYSFDSSTQALVAPGSPPPQTRPAARPGSGAEPSSPTPTTQSVSKNQCWESAIRTSGMAEQVEILRVMKNTHAAAYTGIHMFTAGVFLSIVALSQPLSSEAQEAKKAIARIIRLSRALGHRTVLSAQSGNVLQSLIRVILAKEMKELLAEKDGEQHGEDGLLTTACPTPRPGSPTEGTQAPGVQDTSLLPPLDAGLAPSRSQQVEFELHGLSGALRNADFSEGFVCVQRVIRDNGHNMILDSLSPADDLGQGGQGPAHDLHSSSAGLNLPTNSGGFADSVFGGAYGGLHSSGQSWMWDMNPTFPYFEPGESG